MEGICDDLYLPCIDYSQKVLSRGGLRQPACGQDLSEERGSSPSFGSDTGSTSR